MWLPSVLLVVLKIALEYKQTVFQAIRVIFIVDISRNLGESVKIKKQNKHPLQKWRWRWRVSVPYKGCAGRIAVPALLQKNLFFPFSFSICISICFWFCFCFCFFFCAIRYRSIPYGTIRFYFEGRPPVAPFFTLCSYLVHASSMSGKKAENAIFSIGDRPSGYSIVSK